jgi:hypothetical protein
LDRRKKSLECNPFLRPTITVPVVATVWSTILLLLHPVAAMLSVPPPILVAISSVLTPVLIFLSERGW